MIERRYGRIVNVASIAGKEGNPKMGGPTPPSKAAVIAPGRNRSLEGTRRPRGDICGQLDLPRRDPDADPGPAETQEQINMMLVQNPPRADRESPNEVAALVHFLASGECSFTTGQCLRHQAAGRATY